MSANLIAETVTFFEKVVFAVLQTFIAYVSNMRQKGSKWLDQHIPLSHSKNPRGQAPVHDRKPILTVQQQLGCFVLKRYVRLPGRPLYACVKRADESSEDSANWVVTRRTGCLADH
jgi:hypothetical protein